MRLTRNVARLTCTASLSVVLWCQAHVAYRKNQEFRAQQGLPANSAQGAPHLSDIRYRRGATSYLEVLTNQTNYFSAELH